MGFSKSIFCFLCVWPFCKYLGFFIFFFKVDKICLWDPPLKHYKTVYLHANKFL